MAALSAGDRVRRGGGVRSGLVQALERLMPASQIHGYGLCCSAPTGDPVDRCRGTVHCHVPTARP